jgi:hypothetical protein
MAVHTLSGSWLHKTNFLDIIWLVKQNFLEDTMTLTALEPTRFREDHRVAGGIRTLADVSTYAQAELLVDRLSDAGFPVERVRIVGIDLYGVEKIAGRMTTGRAALAGAATGAWVGLMISLLFSVFTTGAGWLVLLLGGLIIGSLWGAAFGIFAHWTIGGARNLASIRNLQAVRYAVQVEAAHADDARSILGLR